MHQYGTDDSEAVSWWQRPLHEIQNEAIERTIADCSGNKILAAQRLKISLKTVYNKLNQMAVRKNAQKE